MLAAGLQSISQDVCTVSHLACELLVVCLSLLLPFEASRRCGGAKGPRPPRFEGPANGPAERLEGKMQVRHVLFVFVANADLVIFCYRYQTRQRSSVDSC